MPQMKVAYHNEICIMSCTDSLYLELLKTTNFDLSFKQHRGHIGPKIKGRGKAKFVPVLN